MTPGRREMSFYFRNLPELQPMEETRQRGWQALNRTKDLIFVLKLSYFQAKSILKTFESARGCPVARPHPDSETAQAGGRRPP